MNKQQSICGIYKYTSFFIRKFRTIRFLGAVSMKSRQDVMSFHRIINVITSESVYTLHTHTHDRLDYIYKTSLYLYHIRAAISVSYEIGCPKFHL